VFSLCQTSDTHIGLTKPSSLIKMFRRLRQLDEKEPFDLFVHCGDYCGGQQGARSVQTTVKMFRDEFPTKPYISVIGNHDLWCTGYRRKGRPSVVDFMTNYEKIQATFKEYGVHFLDEDGPFRFQGWTFVGHSGWYASLNPKTNDANFLPLGIEGNTHHYLSRKAQRQLEDNLLLTAETDRVVFVSHFPVIRVEGDRYFDEFSWSSSIGDHLQEAYGCKYFFNGHAHQLHSGPLRYECGPDYGKPTYRVWNLECLGR